MRSKSVVTKHLDLVLGELQAAISSERGLDAVFLQEVNDNLSRRLVTLCAKYGWSAHFSKSSGEQGKCDAITALLSRRPFDETSEHDVVEGHKHRRFVSGRWTNSWLVCCHMPQEASQKERRKRKLGDDSWEEGEMGVRVVRQLVDRFLLGHSEPRAIQLVVGGDWNTNTAKMAKLAEAEFTTAKVALFAPTTSTCLDVEWPIDAFLSVRLSA